MTTPLIQIRGIGAHTADILVEYGFKCAEDLAATNKDALGKVPGFGPARAKLVIKAARTLCDARSGNSDSSPVFTTATKKAEKPMVDDTKADESVVVDHLGKKDKSKKKSKKKKKKKEEKKTKKEEKQKKANKMKEPASKKKKKKNK